MAKNKTRQHDGSTFDHKTSSYRRRDLRRQEDKEHRDYLDSFRALPVVKEGYA